MQLKPLSKLEKWATDKFQLASLSHRRWRYSWRRRSHHKNGQDMLFHEGPRNGRRDAASFAQQRWKAIKHSVIDWHQRRWHEDRQRIVAECWKFNAGC